MTEERYPLQNRFTREIRSVSMRDYKILVNARDPSGGHIYDPLSDVPGIVHGGDKIEQTMIPKARVHEAAAETGPLRLLKGKSDPAWEAARVDAVRRAKLQVAEDRSSAAVGFDSFMSTLTAGGYSAALKWFAGEGAGEALAMQGAAHPIANFVGTVAGAVALGLVPIPGLGHFSVGARTGLRTSSIFETSANLARKATSGITGKGFFAEAGRRLGRPLVFQATAEAPLAFALASASIVDNDKDYMGEIGSAFASQYFLSLMIGGALSVPLGLGAAGISKVGGSGFGKTVSSLGRGVVRRFARGNLRGKGPYGVGDAAETELYRHISSATSKMGGDKTAKWSLGRWIGGDGVDDIVNLNRNWRQTLEGIANPTSANALRRNARAALNNAPPEAIPGLQHIVKNADAVFAGRQKLESLFLDADGLAKAIRATEYSHPIGLRPKGGVKVDEIIDLGLEASGAKALGKGAGSYMVRLDKALNARKLIAPGKRAPLDKALKSAFPDIQKTLSQIDKLEDAARQLDNWVSGATDRDSFFSMLGPTQEEALLGATNAGSMRALIGKSNGILRDLSHPNTKVIKDIGPFTAERSGRPPLFVKKDKALHSNIDTYFDDLRPDVDAMAKAQSTVSKLQQDATPLMAARKPMSHIDIMGAQLEAVMTHKQRIGHTLAFIAARGGGIRATTTFGGVFAVRHMLSGQEKRALFTAVHDGIAEATSTPQYMQERLAKMLEAVASQDMDMAVPMGITQATGAYYLRTQLPVSADKAISPWHFSNAEIENFLEAVGAIVEPMSVLATAADGSTSEQAVDTLRAVYPKLYTEMVIDVTDFVNRYGDALGHIQLLGLDTFTGYALGYSDGPAPNLTFQDPAYQTTGQAQSAGAMGGPEHRRMNQMQNTTPAQKVGAM